LAAGAAALAVVLAAGAVTISLMARGGSGGRGGAPNVETAPRLGDPVDLAAAAGAGAEWVALQTAGGEADAGGIFAGDAVLAFAADGGAVLTAVDPAQGRAKWVFDVGAATGDGTARLDGAWADSDGGVVLGIAEEASGGTVVSLDAGGKVLGTRQGAVLLGAANGLVAVREDAVVAVAAARDLKHVKWQAEACPAESQGVLAAEGGRMLVCSADGYRDGPSGRVLGFGPSGADRYWLLDGDVLVKAAASGQALTRIDPKTGDELWSAEAALDAPPSLDAGGDAVLAEGAGQVRALDLETGHGRWELPGDVVIGTADGRVLVGSADGQVSCAQAKTGAVDYGFQIAPFDPGRSKPVLGSKTLYQVDGDALAAYPLEQDAKPRWSLQLPAAQPPAAHVLYPAAGRLWLLSAGELRPLE
jgi:outer membrane protein assembly factor BamB